MIVWWKIRCKIRLVKQFERSEKFYEDCTKSVDSQWSIVIT